MVRALGVPRCSCKSIMSLNPAALELETRFGRIRLPLFSRILVGSNSFISFEKALNRVDGERDVVISTRGSVMPLR